MDQRQHTHPLQRSAERARALSDYIRAVVGQPEGAGWRAPGELFAPGSQWLDALVRAAEARLGTRAPNIIGSALLQHYQWPVIGAAIACYLLDRRVPDLRPQHVQLRYDDAGEPDAIALLSGRFAALPDDPDARHPDAQVVHDQGALRTRLRTAIEEHLGAVIEQLCAQVGCRPRGLWLNVADRCVGTLVWLMQSQGHPSGQAEIAAEVDALIRAPGSPLRTTRVGIFQLSHGEHSQVYLERATCCYWYRTAGGDCCATCPRRAPDDRVALLRAALAAQHPQPRAIEETLA